MAWCTYPRNYTLVHQQLSLHKLHHRHPSQRLAKWFFHLHDATCSIYPVYRIITTCIERATMLWTNNTCGKVASIRKSKPCYSLKDDHALCGWWQGSDEGTQLFACRDCPCVCPFQLSAAAQDWHNFYLWSSPIASNKAIQTVYCQSDIVFRHNSLTGAKQ